MNYVDNLDYHVDESLSPASVRTISRYFPGTDPRRLAADHASIRPKFGGPGEPVADFTVQIPAEHGLPDLVSPSSIEPPGLTASLVLAGRVAQTL